MAYGEKVIGSNQNNNLLVDALLQAISKPGPHVVNPELEPLQGTTLRPLVIKPPRGITESLAGGTVTGIADNSMGPEALPAIPIPAAVPEMPQKEKKQPVLDENGQTKFGRLLTELGIPLAAAAVGLGVPGALPMAAGFNQGYKDRSDKEFDLYGKTKLKDAEGATRKSLIDYKEGLARGRTKQPTDFDVQKEARISVNAMLQNNPTAQIEMIQNPGRYNQMVADQMQVIRARLGLQGNAQVAPKENVVNVQARGREDAIKFLQQNGKAVTEQNINKIMGK